MQPSFSAVAINAHTLVDPCEAMKTTVLVSSEFSIDTLVALANKNIINNKNIYQPM